MRENTKRNKIRQRWQIIYNNMLNNRELSLQPLQQHIQCKPEHPQFTLYETQFSLMRLRRVKHSNIKHSTSNKPSGKVAYTPQNEYKINPPQQTNPA